MAYFWPGSVVPATDQNNNRLSGAKLEVLLAETLTPTPSYTSDEGAVQHTNPVIADSAGNWPMVYLDEAIPVRLRAKNASGSYTLFDVDYYAPPVPSEFDDLVDDVAEVVASLNWGLFDDFSATPPPIPAAVIRITTTGWNEEPWGAAAYIYDSTLDSGDVASNPLTMFEALDGRVFKLDPGQRFTIEMFGGRGDDNGTTGTDNLAALLAAEAYEKVYPYISAFTQYFGHARPLTVERSGLSRYAVSNTYEPRSILHWDFEGTGGTSQGTPQAPTLVFPNTVTAIRICDTNNTGLTTSGTTLNSAAGSRLCGFSIEHRPGGSDRTKHGIHFRAPAHIERINFHNTPGNQIHILAQAGGGGELEGNANGFSIDHCYGHTGNANGIFISGGDANGGRVDGWITHDLELCGIHERDDHIGGTSYSNIQINGYGNNGVSHGGRRYILISDDEDGGDFEPGVTAGYENVWYDVGAGAPDANYPAWVTLTDYLLTRPVAIFVGCSINALYVENGGLSCGRGVVSVSGNGGWINTANHLQGISNAWGLYGRGGIGAYYTWTSGEAGYTNNGIIARIAVGTPHPDGVEFGPNILEIQREVDSPTPWYWNWNGADQRFRLGTSGKVVFEITGPNTAQTFGRSAGVPYMWKLSGLALADEGGSNARIQIYGTAAPASGNHSQGEIVWNAAPAAAGTLGWVCTTTGTPGTWKAISGIAA